MPICRKRAAAYAVALFLHIIRMYFHCHFTLQPYGGLPFYDNRY